MLLDADSPRMPNFQYHWKAYPLEMNLALTFLAIAIVFLLFTFFVKKNKVLWLILGAVLIIISILAILYIDRGIL